MLCQKSFLSNDEIVFSPYFDFAPESSFRKKKVSPKETHISSEGTFEGYASVFSVVDQQNDVLAPGAFTESLKKWRQEGHWPKLLWQHNPCNPIGVWDDMEEDEYGLFVQGHLLLDLPKGREAHILLKEGAVDGLSIGFLPRKSHNEGGARVIDQVDLFEVSLVTFMANPLAYVTSCKERTKDPKGEEPRQYAQDSETKTAVAFGATVPMQPNAMLKSHTVSKSDWTEDYRSTIQWMDRLRDLRCALNRIDRLKQEVREAADR